MRQPAGDGRKRELQAKQQPKQQKAQADALLSRLLLQRAAPPRAPGGLYFSSAASTSSASKVEDGGNDRARVSAAAQEVETEKTEIGRRGASGEAMGVSAFRQKYGKTDPVLVYAIDVIQQGRPVRRTEIPRTEARDTHRHYYRDIQQQREPEDALYLRYSPTPPCGFRNIYWLAFIDEGQAVDSRFYQRDYFSLTCRGLTHFENGTATEFVDVGSWVDEKRAFDHMTSMRGLERIQQMLFFFSWKRKAIKNKHKRVQARLRESAFICHPIACRVLNNINAQCLQIKEWSAKDNNLNTFYSTVEFEKLCIERLHAAITYIQSKINMIGETLSREVPHSKPSSVRRGSYTPASLANLTAQLADANLRERMFPFLRLTELMIIEAVRTHAIGVVKELCGRLCGSNAQIDENDKHAFLRIQITGTVTAPLEVFPTKISILELLHSVIVRYMTALDELPRMIMDARFSHVLTPFEPSHRAHFCRSMIKPSALALEASASDLSIMRVTVEDCFQRVESIRVDHLRCIRAVKVAESQAVEAFDFSISTNTATGNTTTSATAHESALRTWYKLQQYASNAGLELYIGFLVVDQSQFLMDLRDHITRHLSIMNDALPREYHALLESLVHDVDTRIESVTKVPGTLEDAAAWIEQVIEMLPTHSERKLFDAKCQNLARLKILVKERAALNDSHASATLEEKNMDNTIHKLEVTWDSLYETLVLCLEKVHDRNGVHRRSLEDLTTKTEDHIRDELQSILELFATIPTGIETVQARASEPSDARVEVVNRLEELVELDIERGGVVALYLAYDREHRMVSEMPSDQWVSTLKRAQRRLAASSKRGDETLPTELLLQYVITALELRQWFTSWTALRTKWFTTPIVQVHPGFILDRVKLFRKRLTTSSSRIYRLSSLLIKSSALFGNATSSSPTGFATPDHELIGAFRMSIDEVAMNIKVFQAINGGSFADRHWEKLCGLVHIDVARNNVALSMMLRDEALSGTKEKLMEFFDECIVEARLHILLERARERVDRIRVVLCEESYVVRCDGVDTALRELDDIQMDVKLCLYQQNPELQACVQLCALIERHVAVCEYLLQFQKKWLPLFDVLKLHDVEEYAISLQKLTANVAIDDIDQAMWKALLGASQGWSDCMRRIFFARSIAKAVPVNPEGNTIASLKARGISDNRRPTGTLKTPSDATGTTGFDIDDRRRSKRRSCSLDEIVKGFEDFDFDFQVTSCEQGMALIRGYLRMVRTKSPRLHLVSDLDLLYLLTHDQDIAQFHRVLTTCFPHVSRFRIMRCSPHYELEAEGGAPTSDSIHITDSGTSSIVVDGILDTRQSPIPSAAPWVFRMPVTKIGRAQFWLSRIEEEILLLVKTNTKTALRWSFSNYNAFGIDSEEHCEAPRSLLEPLLPQSIVLASLYRFTHEIGARWARHNGTRGLEHIRRLKELRNSHMARISHFTKLLNEGIGSSMATRVLLNLDNFLLLLRYHVDVTDHILSMLETCRAEEAIHFWSLQHKVQLCHLVPPSGTSSTTGARVVPKVTRLELSVDLSTAIQEATQQSLEGVDMCVEIADIQLGVGREFMGWGRVPIISPLTQRCVFALFSALRPQLSTPATMLSLHNDRSNNTWAPRSLLASLTQLMMVPLLKMNCSTGQTHDQDLHSTLEHHIEATIALNALLVLDNFYKLEREIQQRMQENIIHHIQTHRSPTTAAGITALCVPSLSPAIIISFPTHVALNESGLLDTLQYHFRPIAVLLPPIDFLFECLMLPYGYSREQCARTGAVAVFEALAASTCRFEETCGVAVHSIVPSVVGGAMRIRATYQVLLTPLTENVADKRASLSLPSYVKKELSTSLTQKEGGENLDTSMHERRIDETVFRIAFIEVIEYLFGSRCARGTLKSNQLNRLSNLVDALLPLASKSPASLRLKYGETEDAIANAVSICLEESGFQPQEARSHQLERIMDIWSALSASNSVIIYGPCGSGKTTAITVLHRALTGLALASTMKEENVGFLGASPRTLPRGNCSEVSALTIIPCRALPRTKLFEMIKQHVAQEYFSATEPDTCYDATPPRWVLIDGSLEDPVLFEHVESLGSNNQDELDPSSHVSQRLSIDSKCVNRILFESVDLRNLSPVALVACAAIYIYPACITRQDIVSAWKRNCQLRLGVTASLTVVDEDEDEGDKDDDVGNIGSRRLAILFRYVDFLLSNVFVAFIDAEKAATDSSGDSKQALDGLTLNHLTFNALNLVALWCFPQNQSWKIDDTLPSVTTIAKLVAFALLWGFGGHLSHPMQHKLEFYLRAKVKESVELHHLSDAIGSLYDASRFSSDSVVANDDWMAMTSSSGVAQQVNGDSQIPRYLFDPAASQFIALQPVAVPLLRMCYRLVQSGVSFLITGSAASGKSALMRLILTMHDLAQNLETKIDCALDQRQANGVLDWMLMPDSWFASLTSDSGTYPYTRNRAREEQKLFAPPASYTFVFVDDISLAYDDSNTAVTKIEVLRSILDHRICYCSERGTFLPIEKHIGGAARLPEPDWSPNQLFSTIGSRLLRHFVVLHAPEYSQKDLLSIFRVKYNTYFGFDDSKANANDRQYNAPTPTVALPAVEVVLRASAEWMSEVVSLRSSLQAQGIDCTSPSTQASVPSSLIFSWHHFDTILSRTLVFAHELVSSQSSLAREKREVSLVDLGRLHQCWLSELQNVFLINWPPLLIGEPPGAVEKQNTNDDDREFVTKKLWVTVRALSEKYFSAALQDERTLPVSIPAAYFSFRLASLSARYADQALRLKDILTALASSAPSVGTLSRPNRNSETYLLPSASHQYSIRDNIADMVISMKTADPSRSQSKRAVHSQRQSGNYDAMDLKLVLRSPLLTQSLHLINALEASSVLVMSTCHGASIMSRMTTLACDVCGFQILELAFFSNSAPVPKFASKNIHTVGEQGERVRELLVDVLHQICVKKQRIVLLVDWDDVALKVSSAESKSKVHPEINPDSISDGVTLLLSFIDQLSLGQIPSVVLDEQAATLRDTLLMAVIQEKRRMEVASEFDLMQEMCALMHCNLRICLVRNSSLSIRVKSSPLLSSYHPYLMLSSLRSRPNCSWLELDLSSNEADGIIMAIAEQVRQELSTTFSATCSPAIPIGTFQSIHHCMMTLNDESVPIVAEHSVECFLAFSINLIMQWQHTVDREQLAVSRLGNAIYHIELLASDVLPRVAARRKILDLEIKEISSVEGIVYAHGLGDTECSGADAGMQNDYITWCVRAEKEERGMKLCELENERQALALFASQWHQVLPYATGLVETWRIEAEKRRNVQFWSRLLRGTILKAVHSNYWFLRHYNPEKWHQCIHQNLMDEEVPLDPPFSTDWLVPETLEKDITSNGLNRFLSRLIMTAEIPFVNGPLYDSLVAGDSVLDRLPVYVDSSGVIQRYLVRCFSGQSVLWENDSPVRDRKSGGIRVRQDNGRTSTQVHHKSATSNSSMPLGVVVSCQAPDLQTQLSEALRHEKPVLLLDFEPSERLLKLLEPFIRVATNGKSHHLGEMGVLETLGIENYLSHHTEKNSRRSNRRTASVSIASIAGALGGVQVLTGENSTVSSVSASSSTSAQRYARRNSIDRRVENMAALAAMATANPSNIPAQARDHHRNHISMATHTRARKLEFRIVAVASMSISHSTRHRLIHHLAFYDMQVDQTTLGNEFFARIWLSSDDSCGSQIQRSVRDAERVAADCCAGVTESREKLWTVLRGKATTQLEGPTTQKTFMPHLSLVGTLEPYSDLADTLSVIELHERQLKKSCERLRMERHGADQALSVYHPAGECIARAIRCISSLPYLLPNSSSCLYTHNNRWLELRVGDQLVSLRNQQNPEHEDNLKVKTYSEAVFIAHRTLTSVESELLTEAHKTTFRFLQAVHNCIDEADDQTPNCIEFLQQAVSWLSSVELMHDNLGTPAKKLSGKSFSIKEQQEQIPPANGSLVDRFRRKVRLGALLMNCFESSTSRPASLPVPQTPSSFRPLSIPSSILRRHPLARDTHPSNIPSRLQEETASLENALSALCTIVEDYWGDWKAVKSQRRRELERLLASQGIRRARRASLRQMDLSTGISTNTTNGNFVRVKYIADALADFNLFGAVSENDPISDGLARLLLTSLLFPSEMAMPLNRWCALVASKPHGYQQERQSSSSTLLNVSASSLVDTMVNKESTVKLIRDVDPSLDRGRQGKPSVIATPHFVLIYSSKENANMVLRSAVDQSALLTWWWSANVAASSNYYDRLVELVTTSSSSTTHEFAFAIHLLNAKHFDHVVSLVSRVVSDHALLAVPRWLLVCSLPVAFRIMSSKLPLLPHRLCTEDEPSESPGKDVCIDEDTESYLIVSQEIAADLMLVRQPLLRMVDAQPSGLSRAAKSYCLDRVLRIFDALAHTADGVNACIVAMWSNPSSCSPPWWSLSAEVEAQSRFFQIIYSAVQSAIDRYRSQSETHADATATACLVRGFIPHAWISSALDQFSPRPLWPSALVPVAAFAVLIAYRFALLSEWLAESNRGSRSRPLDLAGVHDVRRLVQEFKHHSAIQCSLVAQDLKFVLVADQLDGDIAMEGLAVEGLVLLELNPSDTEALAVIHPLPTCRLLCVGRDVDSDSHPQSVYSNVPLAIIPSLSPFQSRLNASVIVDRVDVAFDPATAGINLQHTDLTTASSSHVALGIPLWASDDDPHGM